MTSLLDYPETWIPAFKTVTDDLDEFGYYLPDFKSLMKSIKDKGILPEKFAPFTERFVTSIADITDVFLIFDTNDERDLSIITDFFQTVINGFTEQISNENELYSKILKNIFEKEDANLYKRNPQIDIRKNIINSFLSNDGFNKCLNIIEKETRSSNKFWNLIDICISISPFLTNEEQKNQFSKLTNIIFTKCPLNIIIKLFDKVPVNIQMISLLLTLKCSKNPEKQIFAEQKLIEIFIKNHHVNDSNRMILNSNKPKAVGLVNLGMTCFLNATLQQFYGIPDFRKTVIDYKGNDSFLIELKNLFCKMSNFSLESVSPYNLIQKLTNPDGSKFNIHEQQDASEYVELLINKSSSIISQEMFHGVLTKYICDKEKSQTEQHQTFSVLSVSIPDGSTKLNQCLDSIHKKELLDDGSIYSENFQSLPKYLVIQLNRFYFDKQEMTVKKNHQTILFPEDLDMKSHLDPKSENQTNTMYHLCGVVIHSGTLRNKNSICHYYSFVKNRNTGEWYKFDDANTAKIDDIDDIMENANGDKTNAYLLFYDRDDN